MSTCVSGVRLLDGAATLESDSVGVALQAGMEYRLNKNWSLTFDVKKALIRSDVYLNGGGIRKVKVDSLLVGVGVGYRF